MRGLVDHELAENALAMSIMDLRRHMRPLADDPVAMALLKEDLALLEKTVEEIEASI